MVQTGEPDDFLTMGAALGEAASRLDRRVVVLASGGMSHTFWPLQAAAQTRGVGTGSHHHPVRRGPPTRSGWSG